jgi:hypothetical protein
MAYQEDRYKIHDRKRSGQWHNSKFSCELHGYKWVSVWFDAVHPATIAGIATAKAAKSMKQAGGATYTKYNVASNPESQGDFKGAFKDTRVRDLPVYKGTQKSYELCRTACSLHKYFGRQHTGQCFCGDTFGKYGAATTGHNCAAKVGGKGWEGSFGGWVNCIWSVNVTKPAGLSNLQVRREGGVSLRATSCPLSP